jgi:transposase-like protein
MALMDGDEPTRTLKRDALGRVTVPRERREALVEEFERSGLPATQFARAAGINYQTFAWWVQQRRHARGDYASKKQARSAALRLVEAVPGRVTSEATIPTMPLELRLPGGASLLVHDPSHVALAAQLLNALRTPC